MLKMNKDFSISEFKDQIILVPVSNQVIDVNSIHLLNKTGAIILKMINNNKGIDEITDFMLKHSNLERTLIKDEIESFIQELIEKGVLL